VAQQYYTDAQAFGDANTSGPRYYSDDEAFGSPSADLIPTPGQRTSGQPSPVSMSGQVYSRGNVGQVAAEAWRAGQVSKDAIDEAEKTTLGHWITSPLLQFSNWPIQAGNALFRGGQELVSEALSPISPQLGRDVAAYPESRFGAVPEAPPLPMRPDWYIRNKLAPPEAPPTPRFVQEYYGEQLPGEPPPPPAAPPAAPTPAVPPAPPAPSFVPPDTPPPVSLPRINELLAADERLALNRPAEIPPTTSVPVPGAMPGEATEPVPIVQPPNPANRLAPQPEASQPQPGPQAAQPAAAGADITQGAIPPLTPTQVQDAFEKSVLQTAEHRTVPGPNGTMVDETPYVPDAQRTLSARIFSPNNSVVDRVLQDTDPEGYGANAVKIENDAKDAIFDDYKKQAGDKNAVDAAIKARDAYSPDQLGVFENEQPTPQGQGIVDYFNRLLDSPEGKRSNVASILKDARDGFLNKDGNAETVPSMLYGGRKNITDILNEGLNSSTSTRKASVQAARKFLTDALENHVDPAINSGSPLFDTFLTQWHALSKPIDRMNFLQEHMFGPGDVRGTDGKIQFQGVQNLLEKMVKLRRGAGTNDAKSFDLPAVRNELAAWHLRDRLFNAAGSPTVQRATAAAKMQSGPLGQAIQGAADVAGHVASFKLFGPMGNVAYQNAARPLVQGIIRGPAARNLARTKEQMLGTTPQNQLGP
jgi:hypothetical protein